jgi:multiple sugar transport system substrate-binding protein
VGSYHEVADAHFRRTFRRLSSIGCLALVALLVGLACDRGGDGDAVDATGRKVVTVWYPFGSDTGKALQAIVAEFERLHPHIDIKLSYAANNLTSSQKLFLAIAGGSAPDVTFVDGQQLAEWAARGALTDITPQVERAGLGADDFWLPRWRESTFAGRVYALPWGADPNFALFWNKRLFREAGLDPERPPRTIRELDEYNARLTKVDEQGRIERLGLIPWAWGGANSLFTWGYAFGGEFYEPPPPGSAQLAGRVTANHPRNVRALEWIQSYAAKHDVRKVAAFRSNFVGVANDPFYLGRTGMSLLHVTQIRYLHKYAPGLEYGVGFIPAPEDGEYPSSWIGGWSLAIPRGSATSDEAFEFMRWMCTSPEGTTTMGREMMQFPAYRKSPYFEQIKDDKDLGVYYEMVRTSTHTRTLMPVQGYLMDLLSRCTDQILYGGRAPQEALDEVTAKAQARLDDVMRNVERRRNAVGATPASPAPSDDERRATRASPLQETAGAAR